MNDREFGSKLDGIDYIDRPGAYAVIVNDHEQIAVIKTERGYFLPGGGIDDGETEIDALKRELIEETGYQISGIVEIGTAVEYINASREEKNYRIQGKFYQAELKSKIGDGSERDHCLIWLPAAEAVQLLARPSQAWAIKKATPSAFLPPTLQK